MSVISVFDQAINSIEAGRRGLNEGLSHGLNRLTEFIPGVQRGNLYLIGGMTSSGKSALGMSMFVNHPYEDWAHTNKRNMFKLKIFVWSMEIAKDILLTKFLCRRIYMDHGKLVDINFVLSRGKNRVSQEIYDLVRSYREYYANFEDIVTIMGAATPDSIRQTLLNYYHAHGHVTYKPVTIPPRNSTERPRTMEVFDRYVPDAGYENLYVIALFDHMNIIKRGVSEGRLMSKKEAIDKVVETAVDFGNDYKLTTAMLQQINRSIEDDARQGRQGKSAQINIQMSDFKESGDTTDAAHFVLAINHPQRWENQTEYKGYDLRMLKDRARFLTVLKNRDGNVDVGVALQFLGEIGAFKELPPAQDMTQQMYLDLQNIRKYTGQPLRS